MNIRAINQYFWLFLAARQSAKAFNITSRSTKGRIKGINGRTKGYAQKSMRCAGQFQGKP